MAVTLNTALIPAFERFEVVARSLLGLTPLGILFQPTCRIKQRGAEGLCAPTYLLTSVSQRHHRDGTSWLAFSVGFSPLRMRSTRVLPLRHETFEAQDDHDT
jgi:hypothetical protein